MEVFHQVKAHDPRGACGYDGITRKVAVELEKKADGCEKENESATGGIAAEDFVDKDGNAVGDDDFKKESPEKQDEAASDVLSPDEVASGLHGHFADLVQHVSGALDRSGYELREEGDEQSIADEVRLGFGITAINVNAVAESLQGIKRDSDREHDIPGIEGATEQMHRRTDQKIEVFEVEKKCQIDDNAEREKNFPVGLVLRDEKSENPRRKCGEE